MDVIKRTLFLCLLAPLVIFPEPAIYSQLENFYHPSNEDYQFVQYFLTYGERGNLSRLGESAAGPQNIRITGFTHDERPKSGMIPVNCPSDDRENCLVIYASFNLNYPQGLKRLLKHAIESDFCGHVLYRLGGWPDTEGGSLSLAHVPNAFRVSFFKEARRLGFKRVLWLDTDAVPLVSLNTLFGMIAEKGYLAAGNTHTIGKYMNPQAAAYFGLTVEDTQRIPSCSAGIFGVDFSTEIGRTIIDKWYKAARDSDAFYTPRSDQNALSIILHQLGATEYTSSLLIFQKYGCY